MENVTQLNLYLRYRCCLGCMWASQETCPFFMGLLFTLFCRSFHTCLSLSFSLCLPLLPPMCTARFVWGCYLELTESGLSFKYRRKHRHGLTNQKNVSHQPRTSIHFLLYFFYSYIDFSDHFLPSTHGNVALRTKASLHYYALSMSYYIHLPHNEVVLFDNLGRILMLKYEGVWWINDNHGAVNEDYAQRGRWSMCCKGKGEAAGWGWGGIVCYIWCCSESGSGCEPTSSAIRDSLRKGWEVNICTQLSWPLDMGRKRGCGCGLLLSSKSSSFLFQNNGDVIMAADKYDDDSVMRSYRPYAPEKQARCHL